MFNSNLYLQDLKQINECNLPWDKLNNKTVLITGATGLIGSVLVDAFIYRNEYLNGGIKLLLLGRSEKSILEKFKNYVDKEYFNYIVQDIESPISTDESIEYIIHAASKGDPKSFAENPIGIMNANYIGTYQVLELARKQKVQKVLFISTGEIYGIVKKEVGSIDGLKECDYGFMDVLNARSCYASSKRAGETLCAAYYQQHKVDFNVARPCHTYGASMQDNDSRVICEFFRKALSKEDIIMKSAGTQIRSYCYVADTIKGLLYILLLGAAGEAYNIANKNSTITIRELAEKVSQYSQSSVIYENPSDIELRGFSNIQHAILDATKLEELGWSACYNMDDGITRTLEISRKNYVR